MKKLKNKCAINALASELGCEKETAELVYKRIQARRPMKKQTAIEHAVKFLHRHKYEIIDRNLPRFGVDIVAWDRWKDSIVFIKVKPHESPMAYARRLRPAPKAKRDQQRKAIRSWLRENKWRGAYRFDTIDIYGADNNPNPVIDHIFDIKIFAKK